MDSDKDVLGKADALLRRHAAGAPGAGSETGAFPVLTDLYDEGPPTEPVPMPASAPVEVSVGELAQDVFTHVMAEVEGRLAADLEKRVVEHLVPHVNAAVASALGDLRQELANAIGDAVEAALRSRQVK